MIKFSFLTRFMLGLLGAGAVALGVAVIPATAVTSCTVSNANNVGGYLQFEIQYSSNTAGCAWTVPAGVTQAEVAVVGAGGTSGSVQQPGGGGGGAVLYNPSLALTPGSSISATVGQGVSNVYNVQPRGASGGSTSFGSVTAQGGGGGGSGNQYQSGNWLGAAGGSSGGASRHGRSVTASNQSTYTDWTVYSHTGGLGSGVLNTNTPTAYNGDAQAFGAGGGGGGAGGNGSDSTTVVNGSTATATGGNGGPGIYLMGKCLGAGAPGMASSTTSVTRSSATFSLYTGTYSVTGTAGVPTDCVKPDGTVVTGSATATAANLAAVQDTGSANGPDTIQSDNVSQLSANGVIIIRYLVASPTFTSATLTKLVKPTISGTSAANESIWLTVGGATYNTTATNGSWSVNLNTATPNSGTLALNANGNNSVSVYSVDSMGGISNTVQQTIYIDTIAPTNPAITGAASLTNNPSTTFTFSSEVGATNSCSLDGTTYTTCSSPYATSNLPDGSHSLAIKSSDAAGNVSGITSFSWTIDTTAPILPVISNSASYINSTLLNVNFTIEVGATATCRLDAATFASCTSSTTMSLTGLSQGSHTITVKATDTAQNSSASSYTFIVDTVAPASPSISSSELYSTNASRSIIFSAEAGATTSCSIDSGAYNSCTSPFTTPTLAEGSHTFRAKTTDAAGNVSSISSYSWTQDSIAPLAPAITNTAAYIAVTNASIAFTLEANATATCSLDSGSFVSCNSPFTTGTLSQGSHTFYVKQTDLAGNQSNAGGYTFTVDSIIPATPVISSNGEYSNANSRAITFSAEPQTTSQCSIDNANFTACTSPVATGILSDGNHTFRVKSTDLAGNTSATSSYGWVQDTDAPLVPVISTTAAFQTTGSPSIFYSGEVGGAFLCRLDSAAFANCSSPVELSNLSEGSHTFNVIQTDVAGNTSPTASYTWTQDTLAPIPPSISANSSYSITTSRSIGFTSEALSTSMCSLDGATFAACSSPFFTGVLNDGIHSLSVKSADAAGNTSVTDSYTWTQDTLAPASANISTTGSLISQNHRTIEFTIEAGGVAKCSLDSSSPSACSSPYATGNLSDGNHTFSVTVFDAAGNAATPTNFEWTQDTVAPAAPVKNQNSPGPSGRTTETFARFYFSVEPDSRTECALFSNQPAAFAWTECANGLELTNLSIGNYLMSFRSVDAAGNISELTNYEWSVRGAGPGVPTINFDANIVSLSGATTGANGDSYEVKVVDSQNNIVSPWATAQASFALHRVDGNYTVYARLVDDLGQIGEPVSLDVTVTGQLAPVAGSSPRLNIASTFGYSQSSSLDVTIDWPMGTKNVLLTSTQNSNGGAGTLTSLSSDWTNSDGRRTLTWNFTPAGVPTVTATHTLTAEFLDAAGQVLGSQSSTVIIDVQAPTFTNAIPTSLTGTTLPIQILASDEVGGSGVSGALVTRSSISAAAVSSQLLQIVNGFVTIDGVALGDSFSISVKDAAGNISTNSFSVVALNRQTLNPIATLSGIAKVGQTLTVKPGVWPKTHKLSFVWKANGIAIPGATKSTFKLTNAQAGKVITVDVLGTRATYYPVVSTTRSSASVVGGTFTPGVVRFTGSTNIGETLTASPGIWLNEPTLSFTWKRGSTIVGTGANYQPVSTDAGQKLSLIVTATKTGFTSLSKTFTSPLITGGTITSSPVAIVETFPAGARKLSVQTGAWGPGPVALSYQWLRDGVAISRATATSYTLTDDDLGADLAVTVTAKKLGYTTISVTSSTLTIETANFIDGSAQLTFTKVKNKKILSVTNLGWSPVPTTYSYAWFRDGVLMDGVTTSTYAVQPADLGVSFYVMVAAKRFGFTTSYTDSNSVTPTFS